MSKATFADSEKQDFPPPASHCTGCTSLWTSKYEHRRSIEGVLNLEQCNFWRAEEWLRSIQLHKKALMCLIKSSNETRDERLPNSLNHFLLKETLFLHLEHALGPTAAFSVFLLA